jgi:hypothetical protein
VFARKHDEVRSATCFVPWWMGVVSDAERVMRVEKRGVQMRGGPRHLSVCCWAQDCQVFVLLRRTLHRHVDTWSGGSFKSVFHGTNSFCQVFGITIVLDCRVV